MQGCGRRSDLRAQIHDGRKRLNLRRLLDISLGGEGGDGQVVDRIGRAHSNILGDQVSQIEFGDALKATVAVQPQISRFCIGYLHIIGITDLARPRRVGKAISRFEGAENVC